MIRYWLFLSLAIPVVGLVAAPMSAAAPLFAGAAAVAVLAAGAALADPGVMRAPA